MAAQRTGPPGTIAPVLIPFLRTVYSVVQFGNPGPIRGQCQLYVMLHYKRSEYDAFHSLRTVFLFGLVTLALMANGKKPIAAAQLAPRASRASL